MHLSEDDDEDQGMTFRQSKLWKESSNTVSTAEARAISSTSLNGDEYSPLTES